MSADGVTLPELTGEEAWMLYDLVAARTEALESAEIAAMSPLGADPWRKLRAKIRDRLPVLNAPELPALDDVPGGR